MEGCERFVPKGMLSASAVCRWLSCWIEVGVLLLIDQPAKDPSKTGYRTLCIAHNFSRAERLCGPLLHCGIGDLDPFVRGEIDSQAVHGNLRNVHVWYIEPCLFQQPLKTNDLLAHVVIS